jgi:PAS domain S-box-containing protein
MVTVHDKSILESILGGEDTYRLIVDSAEEGIWILDKDDKITLINNKMVEMTGYAKNEFIGKRFIDFVDKDFRIVAEAALERRHKGIRETFVLKLMKKDGGSVWVVVASAPFMDDKGLYLGDVGLCSDITILKAVEEELAEEKRKSDMFSDLMSHDIKNMNQVAIGFLELAIEKMKKEGKLEGDDISLLLKTMDSLQRSAKLTSDVKLIKSLKTGEQKSELLDLGEMLSEVVKEHSHVPGRDISINYQTVKGYTVKANILLKEIFVNLVDNAIKHSIGPLTINIDISEIKLEGSHYYKVIIEDDGPGISDIRKRQLFQRFKSYESNTFGYGLYLVRTLTEDFLGKVLVENRVPEDYMKGSKFIVLLPAAEK